MAVTSPDQPVGASPIAADPSPRQNGFATSPIVPAEPTDRTRATVVTPTIMASVAVAVAVAAAIADPRAPTATDWHIVGILALVAVVGIVVGHRFSPQDSDSAAPWDVHTTWILPAALLTPPAAFGALVGLSMAAGLLGRGQRLHWRVAVASITVLTSAALHASAQLIDGFALSAVVGIVALWIIGAAAATTVAKVIGTPMGTVLWLDPRWSLVELGCAFCAMLVAAVMRTDPTMGLAALAPLLFASFALRWPDLTWHARVDPKTGLPNAWHWDERSRALLAAAEVRSTPAAVMIIDLDRFKLINDTYGHLAGDQVLNNLADALRDGFRRGDLVGRFGGEEFVATVFGLTPAAALATAERIRQRVEGLRHDVAGVRGRDTCTITCTIGLSVSNAHGYDLTHLLDMADLALASGKAAGRNQVRDAETVLCGAGIACSPPRPDRSAGPRSMWALVRPQRPGRRPPGTGTTGLVR